MAHKVVILFDRIGPYHQARLEAAGQRMHVIGIELAGESSEYAWEKVCSRACYKRITLFPQESSSAVPPVRMHASVHAALDRYAPDAVAIPGWSSTGSLSALQWCSQTGTPAIVMSETTAHDFQRSWWKERVKQHLVALFDAALVGGQSHKTYLERLGMPDQQIFAGYDVVDNRHFAEGARRARQNAAQWRAKRRLPEQYFLASCRFIPKKNLARLIKAYSYYCQSVANEKSWDLVLLGDGPERPALEQLIEQERLQENVHLPGFKQYGELPIYYGLASAFVHASTTEQWGLVVNEAMAAGLPVLVSKRCGCAPDLVCEAKNGYTFSPYDVEELAEHLRSMASGACNRMALARASQAMIASYRPEAFGSGLCKAVDHAIEASRPHPALTSQFLLRALSYR